MTYQHKQRVVPTTWIVVADRSQARIFASSSGEEPLEELDTLVFPESQMRKSEIVSDRQGYFRGKDGALDSGDPEKDFKHHTAEQFAVQIAHHIDAARQHQQFGRLALVAPPLFLGVLRKKLPTPVAQMVAVEIDKDYSQQSTASIQGHLRQQLWD